MKFSTKTFLLLLLCIIIFNSAPLCAGKHDRKKPTKLQKLVAKETAAHKKYLAQVQAAQAQKLQQLELQSMQSGREIIVCPQCGVKGIFGKHRCSVKVCALNRFGNW